MIKQIEAKYTLYDRMEAMLSPQAMSEILQRDISQVSYETTETVGGNTGCQFYKVRVDEQQYFVKRFFPQTDWAALGTNDTQIRSVRIWEYGLLDQLQPAFHHGILGACHTEDGMALLMEDLSDCGISFTQPHTSDDVKIMLDGLAHMHAHFWNDESLLAPHLGILTGKTLLEGFWPTAHNKYHQDSAFDRRWGNLFGFLDDDVRDAIEAIFNNPEHLYTKLKTQPFTLIHGDVHPANYALLREKNQVVLVVLFDWQVAGYSHPLMDVHWFFSFVGRPDQFDGLEYYRQQLSTNLETQFDAGEWEAMVQTGYLVYILTRSWAHGTFASQNPNPPFSAREVATYNQRIRKALNWL